MFPPNIDPQTYTISAAIVGALISPEFTANEANTVGNWLILVGDYLLTYAGQIALIEGRMNQQNTSTNTNNLNQMDSIQEALQRMNEELEKIKNGYFS